MTIKIIPAVVLLLGLIFSGESMSAITIKQAVPDEYLYCTVCHGTMFTGNPGTQAPRISGLPAWYLESQLKAFRSGARGSHPVDISGHEMRAAAEGLNTQSITRIAKIVSELSSSLPMSSVVAAEFAHAVLGTEAKSPALAQGSSAANHNRGKSLYQQCSGCHGERAEGKAELFAPPLISLSDWYIKKQVQNFRQGLRGVVGDDVSGQQMRLAVENLKSEQEIMDIVAYIQQLKVP